MKYLLTIGCLLLVTDMIRANDVEIRLALEEYITPCAKEHNVLPEEIPKVGGDELEGDQRMKIGCMNACVIKKLNLFDGEKFHEDTYRDVAVKLFDNDEERIAAEMENLKECVGKVKDITDECEIGYILGRCMEA